MIASIFVGIAMFIKLLYFNNLIGGRIYSIVGLVISLIGALFILLCLIPIVKGKWRIRSMLILNIVITLLIISNLLFYRYFNDIITLPIITQIIMVGSVSSSVLNLIHLSDLLFFVDFLLFIPAYRITNYQRQYEKYSWPMRVLLSIGLLAAGSFLSYYGICLLDKNQPKILTTFYDKSYIAQHIGLINYHAIDAFKFIKEEIKEKIIK